VSNITIVATSSPSTAIASLRDAIAAVSGLSPGVFKNPNMANALINKINVAIGLINQGSNQEALDKLQNDILGKTNGCATSGSPDANDWITSCAAQSPVYAKVAEAIAKLSAILQ
jgi:hypothetical protein